MANNYQDLIQEYNSLLVQFRQEITKLKETRDRTALLNLQQENVIKEQKKQIDDYKKEFSFLKKEFLELASIKKRDKKETKTDTQKMPESKHTNPEGKTSIKNARALNLSFNFISFSGIIELINSKVDLPAPLTKRRLIGWCLEKEYLEKGDKSNTLNETYKGKKTGILKRDPIKHKNASFTKKESNQKPGFLINKKAAAHLLENLDSIVKFENKK